MTAAEPAVSGRLAALLDRLLDTVIVGFAVWTVVFQLGLWTGATRIQVAVAAAVLTAPVVWWTAFRQRAAGTVAEERSIVDWSLPAWAAVGGVIVALVALAAGHDVVFWIVAVGALGSGAVAARRARLASQSRPSRLGAGVVLAVALAAALVSATQVDWSKDTTYYVDRAFAIRDAPGPLPVGRDTLFSADGRYPSLVPENDLGSLEGLVGTMAAVAGGHPMSWFSYVVHPGFAFFGVIALWRAGRALGTRHPHLVAVFGTLGVYLASAEGGIATRAFSARTGRNGFVVLLAPVIVAYAAELIRRPGPVPVARFAAAGIGAGGLILSALPVLPVLAVGAAAAVWRHAPSRREWGWLLTATGIVVAYGAALVVAAVSLGRAVLDLDSGEALPGPTSADIWAHALGDAGIALFLSALVLLAWLVAPTRSTRRFVIAAPLCALVFAFGPLSLVVLERTAVGTALWRLAWSLPLGVIIGVVAAGLWELRPAAVGWAAVAGLLVVELLVVSARPALPLALPAWDLSDQARSATHLVALAQPGEIVAAPLAVSALVPVLTNEVYVVEVFAESTSVIAGFGVAGWEPEARDELMGWLEEGAEGRDRAGLAQALDVLAVEAVCVAGRARSPEVRRALLAAGFERAGGNSHCQFWVRSP